MTSPDPDHPAGHPDADEFRPGAWRSDEAHDPLTRLCEQMTDLALAHDPDMRVVIILDQTTHDGRGGLQLHGFEDERDAITTILVNVKLLMQSTGGDIAVVPMPLIPGMQQGVGQS